MTCSANCVIVFPATANQGATFTITELYDSVVRLSTEDNVKLLDQLKSSFKKTVSWKKINQKCR